MTACIWYVQQWAVRRVIWIHRVIGEFGMMPVSACRLPAYAMITLCDGLRCGAVALRVSTTSLAWSRTIA